MIPFYMLSLSDSSQPPLAHVSTTLHPLISLWWLLPHPISPIPCQPPPSAAGHWCHPPTPQPSAAASPAMEHIMTAPAHRPIPTYSRNRRCLCWLADTSWLTATPPGGVSVHKFGEIAGCANLHRGTGTTVVDPGSGPLTFITGCQTHD